MAYPNLFSPFKLRNLTIPNRTVMPPMSTQLGTPEGLVTPNQIAFYRARAKGGTGMIIVEFCCVDRATGQSEPNQLTLEKDEHIDGHRRLVRSIRDAGAVACLQLQHGGGAAKRSLMAIDTLWGPSDVASPRHPDQLITRAMTHQEIEYIIECFGRSAELGVRAGYQAVELHGAHGYLITQFLSPHFNRRNDAWGGSEINRMEFPRRIISRVRKAIGNRPLILRISADEFVKDGLTIEDMERITPQLVEAGLDALHVSLGIGPDSFDKVLEPMSAAEGWRLPYAHRIHDVNRVPVIAVGQIRQPDTAEQALINGDADLIALGRTLLADPDWSNKAKSGLAKAIIPCTSCNYCVSNGFKGNSVTCANNPRTGRESEPFPKTRKRSQQAVVVGGGPGGMAAALLLDQAGFNTCLMEARDNLGGGLIASAAPPHKQLIARYQNHLQLRLSHSRVDVKLGQYIDAPHLIETAPQWVIIATGAPYSRPAFDQAKPAECPPEIDAYRLLMGDKTALPAPKLGPIAVYGGGETGCETAEWLLQKGYEVMLITRSARQQLARAAEMIYRMDLLGRLLQHPHLTLYPHTHLVNSSLTSLTLESHDPKAPHQEPRQFTVNVAALVTAQGRYADGTLQEALQQAGINTITIGDAKQSGRIGDAVQDAYRAVKVCCDL